MLEIKESNIPNSGLGVFVTEFISSEIFLGYYAGDLINEEECSKRQTSDKLFEINSNLYVDGKSICTYINDCILYEPESWKNLNRTELNLALQKKHEKLEYNVNFIIVDEKIEVWTTQNINKNEELYGNYSAVYWYKKFLKEWSEI